MSATQKVWHELSATWSNTQKGATYKKVQHEKIATWKEWNMEKCNTDKVQHEMSATQENATWSECNMKQH